MRKIKTRDWLLTLAAAVGLASSASAQETRMVQRADAILGGPERSLVQQIGYECARGASCDAPACDASPVDGMSCDSVGCDSCYLFDGCDFAIQDMLGEDSAYSIGGWYQLGYHNRSTGLFNNRPGQFATHQAWLYAEKVADGSKGLDWGFRADVMYGIDAGDTQAFGNNNDEWDFGTMVHGAYGFAIPQLYAEIASGDWSVKAGHFYTLLGYEVVTAPDNFFYSHAFTMFNTEAFTHTGALATYSASDNVTLYGGWTLGWDTGFDQKNGGSNFLGGTSIGLTDELTATFITTIGNFGNIGSGYSHSLVLDFALTDSLNYVFQSDYLDADDPANGSESFGINQYLLYTINDCWGVGGRAEWWRSQGSSIYALTAGVNYRPSQNLVIRPEIRYQWDPGTANNPVVTNLGGADGDAIFGIDAILTF